MRYLLSLILYFSFATHTIAAPANGNLMAHKSKASKAFKQNKRTEAIKDIWKKITRFEEIKNIGALYSENVEYTDPLVRMVGLGKLIAYWENLRTKYISIEFEYQSSVIQGDQHVVKWIMVARSEPLNDQQEIRVPGLSHIHFDSSDQIVKQVDYMDMGAALYEHLPPPIGTVLKKIKADTSNQWGN